MEEKKDKKLLDLFMNLDEIKKFINENAENRKDFYLRNYFNRIIKDDYNDKIKSVFVKSMLQLPEEDIERLMQPYYVGYTIENVHNESVFSKVISTKDLKLIKNSMKYIYNINLYLKDAVATGDIDIVKFFLEKGANINYLTDEAILGELTPLKTAILNNDYEMVKFLIDNGADVDLKVNDEDFIKKLKNHKINIYDVHGFIIGSKAIDLDGSNKNYIEKAKEDDDSVKSLKYVRTSSPLEFATKISSKEEIALHCFNINFEGHSLCTQNEILVNTDYISIEALNRIKIVDLIFDKSECKKNVNYNDLIVFTFATRDFEKFVKYSKFAVQNNYQFDFDLLFKSYLYFGLDDNKEMINSFLSLIEKYDKNNELYLKFFDMYLNIGKRHKRNIYNSSYFNKKLLAKIPEEKRKNICLVPYCKDVDSLEYYMSLGFDINQVDENNKNILHHLLNKEIRVDDLDDYEMALFNYLLNHLDLSLKDNDNKTALYYAMKNFNTEREICFAKKQRVETRSNLEKAAAKLITKMPKEDVCNDDINAVLEERLKNSGSFFGGGKMDLECIYQHHKELFDALINKGFVLSDKVLDNVFSSLYPKEIVGKIELSNKIDMSSTLDYLYQKLDRNIEIQKLNIEQEFEDLIDNMEEQDITFDEYIKNIKNFYNHINELNDFYENNIKKKFNPEKYLEYAEEKYNTTYTNLNKYLSLIITIGIEKFGNKKLSEILDAIPNYTINNYIEDSEIGVNYFSCVTQIDMSEFDINETNKSVKVKKK